MIKLLFEPMPAKRLAIIRIAIGLFTLWHLLRGRKGYMATAHEPASNWDPVGPATLFPAPPGPELVEVWFWATIALGVCFVLGIGHRVLAPLFGASVLTFLAWRTSWQKVYHSDNLLVLQLFIVCVVPAASAWSADAWARVKFGDRFSWTRWPLPPETTHWWYGWPIRLMCAVTTITYLLAGLAKVWGPAGWAWAKGTNLRDQIGKDALYKDLIHHTVSTDVTTLAYNHTEILTALAFITLVVEVGAPYALLHKYLARAWVFGAYGMHIGISVIMHITFIYPCTGIAFLCFLEPETWVEGVIKRLPQRGSSPAIAPGSSPGEAAVASGDGSG